MRLYRAKLVKHATADGLIEMEDSVPLGKEYVVDLDTRAPKAMFHLVQQIHHEREMVAAVDGGWLPTELLDLPPS